MNRIALSMYIIAVFMAACSPKVAPSTDAKSGKDKKMPTVSYAADIVPIMSRSCSPCHYPAQGGKKEALDSYAAASKHAQDIIARVTLPQTDAKFMPYNLKKPALTAEEVALLKAWVDGGMKE